MCVNIDLMWRNCYTLYTSKLLYIRKKIPKVLVIKLNSKRFGDVTLHRLEFDLLKSTLQKYIRCGKCKKAVWDAIELDEHGFQSIYQKQ